MQLGLPEGTDRLIARISRRSLQRLDLRAGDRVIAQVKGVSNLATR